MHILLDLQACQSACRTHGMGRYSLSIALAIVELNTKHKISLLLNNRFPETIPNIRNLFQESIPPERIFVFDVPNRIAELGLNTWKTRCAENLREYAIAQIAPDIVHISSLFEGYHDDAVSSVAAFQDSCITAVTLYDLIPFIIPDQYLANDVIKEWYYNKIDHLKKADLLLGISEHSCKEAIEHLGFNQNHVKNISAAVSESFEPAAVSQEAIEGFKTKYGIDRPFVLYPPSGFDTRKNIPKLFTAFSKAVYGLEHQFQLVLVGKLSELRRDGIAAMAVQNGLRHDELILTDYVSDEDLINLYRTCHLFVFPSTYEGFGLPVLEAMSCGAPAIAANATSLPEIVEHSDALFDPLSVESMAATIRKALTNSEYRSFLKRNSINQSSKFSWKRSAQKALEAFETSFREKNISESLKRPDGDILYQELIKAVERIPRTNKPHKNDLIELADSIAKNTFSSARKIAFIDISTLIYEDAKSGIQRVVRSIMLNLRAVTLGAYTPSFIYFDSAVQVYRYAESVRVSDSKLEISPPTHREDIVDFLHGDLFLGLDLVPGLAVGAEEFLTQLNRRGIQIYFVIYDILLVQHPEWWPQGTADWFEQWLTMVSKVSNGVICISQAVANEYRVWLQQKRSIDRVEPISIKYFHLGADIGRSVPTKGLPDNADRCLARLQQSTTFLMVGTIEPRKGHALALDTFNILWQDRKDLNLVIVGKQGWLVDELITEIQNHPLLNENLFWLNGISDEYLEKIYSASTVLLAPSEGEGFGLPLIEAAQHKIPIIARNIPVFREVAGDHAFYIEGSNSHQLADEINNWLRLYTLNKIPHSKALPWLTWKESTQQLLNILVDDNEGGYNGEANKAG